jgi:hypothetical protein
MYRITQQASFIITKSGCPDGSGHMLEKASIKLAFKNTADEHERRHGYYASGPMH